MVTFKKTEWNLCDFLKRGFTKCPNTQYFRIYWNVYDSPDKNLSFYTHNQPFQLCTMDAFFFLKVQKEFLIITYYCALLEYQ